MRSAKPSPRITLTILDTPEGVLIHANGQLDAVNGATSVARTLCLLTLGLFEGGQPVCLAPEIVGAWL